MEWVKRAWRGEERLWKVFWIYGFLGSIGLGIALSIVSAVLGSISAVLGLVGSIAYIGVSIIYTIWLWVSQWRCAFNADWRIWGYIIRFLMVTSIIAIICAPFGVYHLYKYNEKAEAECRKIVADQLLASGAPLDESSRSFAEAVRNCKKERFHIEETRTQNSYNLHYFNPSNDTAPAPSLPPAAKPLIVNPPAAKPSWDSYFTDACKQTMTDYAKKHGADPEQYIAQNQAWLQQCVQRYINQNNAAKKNP